MVQRVRTVAVKCRQCADVIVSTHVHDFKRCKCGEISVDGGKSYINRSAKDLNNIDAYDEVYESDF